MTNEKIKAKVKDIFSMSEVELEEFGVELSLSTVNEKTKFYLFKIIDERLMQLIENIEMQGCDVVSSEINMGDF